MRSEGTGMLLLFSLESLSLNPFLPLLSRAYPKALWSTPSPPPRRPSFCCLLETPQLLFEGSRAVGSFLLLTQRLSPA